MPKITDFIDMAKQGPLKDEEKLGTVIVGRIDKRAAEIGTTRPELAEKAKIAKNTFANWASRGTVLPADVALVISDELQCSVRWLVTGKKDKQEEYTIEEKNLVSKFRLLDRQGQFEVKALLEAKTVPVGRETVPEILTAAEKKRIV